MARSDFTKMCNPAKLYLLVSVLGLVYGIFQRFSIVTLGTNFIFVILWTMVLNWLCSVGMKMVSWILVLLPYLMMFLSAGFVMDMMNVGGKKEGFEGSRRACTNSCPGCAPMCKEMKSKGIYVKSGKTTPSMPDVCSIYNERGPNKCPTGMSTLDCDRSYCMDGQR